MSNLNSIKEVHHNIPQLMWNIVKAHITVCFWGRGTGKTEGPGVDFTLFNALSMPQSLGGVVSVSYDKLLTFIVPKLLKGYERYGYLQGVHFWDRKFAPSELKRKRPFLSPSDPKHFIHFFNGSGLQLLSLDRLGISNAADLDYIYADECKLFDYDKFVEVLHTNRGNKEHFGHLSQHHSILLTTDRPQNSNGDWLYDIAENADGEMLELVLMIQQRIFELNEEVQNSRTKKSRQQKLKLIEEFEEQLNELRRELVYVSEASTLDNIHALGADVIKDLKRELSDIVFRISVLNERIREVEDGYYKDLDDRKHGYLAIQYDYIDRQDINFKTVKANSKWYNDINSNEPLDIALDYNAKINNIVTGQSSVKRYNFIHAAYSRGKIQDLFTEEWHPFFKAHPCKHVNFFYDHTAIPEKADSAFSYADTVVQCLERLGWTVNRVYIGQQPSHRSRFLLWEKLLNNMDSDYPSFSFNRSTCEYWYDRCKDTGTRISREGFEKDKTNEKKPNFDQAKAPHITDAGDTLLIGAVHRRHKLASDFTETGVY